MYLSDLSSAEPVRFSYVLQATTPLSVKTLPTRAYDLANPRRPAVLEPVRISVLQQEGT
jgi:hypothetical protein